MSDAAQVFGKTAAIYKASRPTYPGALFDWIASEAPALDCAWDCATGNGQAAQGLAKHFARVEATDLAEAQLKLAETAPNIRYSHAPAEETAFADRSFDCITVAQALHWFDYGRFWPEVKRVAKPGAFFCAFGYAWFQSPPEIDAALVEPMKALLEPYWSAKNAICWNGFRNDDIKMPFPRIESPPFAIEVDWTIGEFAAYVRSWSAFIRMRDEGTKIAEAEALLRDAERRFAGGRRRFTMPLDIVAARID